MIAPACTTVGRGIDFATKKIDERSPIYTSTPKPRPPSAVYFEKKYRGEHPIPPSSGGGWDATAGSHTHVYSPDSPEEYRVEDGHYVWTGRRPAADAGAPSE